ncbi:MAG: Uncharacterized MFS-type transporter [uncultured Thermomicrobiales bacterium]|uniref:Uncharacterized MFS-type transporter n=1 Tax=uncultured Thermomicrobiales bacterium TaxID=1645740 RepID=A0A6J4VB37_9BACT|nr:MAG: Uncharacterized MFS-type transporter [uncultured Thermomicrobiales bacterium]
MSRVAPAVPGIGAEASPDPRRWLALVVVLAAPLMAIFGQFVVNVAIATMQRDLRASFGQIQLVIAAYALAYAVLLVTGGRLGDLFGRKRLFLVGLGGFTLASALCGLAADPVLLIAARVAQGAAAALMSPQVLAIIRVTFPPREQSVAFALYGATLGLAGILGQLGGGLLIRANIFGLGWRPIFLINLPVGLAAFVAAVLLLRESRAPAVRRLDLGGVAILTAGLFLLVGPLVVGRDTGWPPWSRLCLLAAAPALAGFVAFERWLAAQGGAPLIDLALFRDRAFSLGLVVTLLLMVSNAGYFLILALYLQIGLGFSPLTAGLIFTPDAVGFFLAATLSARLAPKLGSRLLILGVGLRIVGLALAILAARGAGAGLRVVDLLPGLFLQGFGSGCVSAPLVGFILQGIRGRAAGAAAGVLTTVQQVANALGVAVIGLLFFGLLGRGAEGIAAEGALTLRQELVGAGAVPAALDATLDDFRACARDRAVARDPIATPPSCDRATLRPADAAVGGAITEGLSRARARGYGDAFVTTLAWIVAGLAGTVLLMLRLPTTPAVPDD